MIDKLRMLKRQYKESAIAVHLAEEKWTEGCNRKAGDAEIRVLHQRLEAARARLADVKLRLFDLWG